MNEDYSKRELDEHFSDVKNLIRSVEKKVEAIDQKVSIQNGRIGVNEKSIVAIKSWTKGIIVSGSIVTLLITIIVSLAVYSFGLRLENTRQAIELNIKSLIETK